MVRAILDGRKTQTRRAVKGTAAEWLADPIGFLPEFVADPGNGLCPYGYPGDALWVREAHYLTDDGDNEYAVYAEDAEAVTAHLAGVRRIAVQHSLPNEWLLRHTRLRPSIHMPRWASRITLEVVDVRVERLNAISEADAGAEGVKDCGDGLFWVEAPGTYFQDVSALGCFAFLWERINGEGSWDLNPWVWVVSFQRITEHTDAKGTLGGKP